MVTMYIYHMPYEERMRLCFILDQNKKWEELGLNHMRFDEMAMDRVRKEELRGNSPSTELLTMWSHQNHKVLELFILLNRMGIYQGMSILKPFVDPLYHTLIKEDNLNGNMKKLQVQDSNIPLGNFDKNTVKVVTKRAIAVTSNEANETNNLQQKPLEQLTNQVANVHINNPFNSPRIQDQKDSTRLLTACVALNAGATPQIPYEELGEATDNWKSSRILGQGGFGTVYRGVWKHTQVAIKRLESKESTKKDFTEQIRQSVTELHCLNAYKHDNILALYGYSIGGLHPCLVYQYMPGGSLHGRIRTKDQSNVLTWRARLNIATGTARGLQFLHTTLHHNKPLIHGDIKSANILLDIMDQPRIGDFGLAREGPENHYTHVLVSRVHGTRPYLPEEFLRSRQFSTKIDTYSFGVVLFELATAYHPTGDHKQFLRDLVVKYPEENILKLKDPRAEGGEDIFMELIEIGKACVKQKARDRPDMVSVFLMLEKASRPFSVQ